MTEGGSSGNAPGSAPRTPVLWITPHHGRELPRADGLPRRRFRHAADLAWSPVDAVLVARDLSNLIVVAATLGVAALCVRDGGLDGLIVNLPGLAVIWGAIYGLIRLGRWWRGVHPPEHQPPRLEGSKAGQAPQERRKESGLAVHHYQSRNECTGWSDRPNPRRQSC